MDSSTHLYTRWLTDESGVTAIEYALLAALIAMAIIGGATLFGNSLSNLYEELVAAAISAIGRN